jgi:hypothetical protein
MTSLRHIQSSQPRRVEFHVSYMQQQGNGPTYMFMYVPFSYKSKGKFVPMHTIKAY